MLLLPALVKLKLFAEHIAGSLNPCFACCPEHRGEQHHKPVICNCPGDAHHLPSDRDEEVAGVPCAVHCPALRTLPDLVAVYWAILGSEH